VINQDIYTKMGGGLVLPKDHIVNLVILEKIQQAAQGIGVVEPFRVLVRPNQASPGQEDRKA
jgi:hypothetical protein